MGMEYDGTPEKTWIGAKVYVEYAIMLVNTFILREESTDIPQAIVQAVKNNVERAAAQLPKATKKEPYWRETLATLRPDYERAFTPPPSKSGYYEGTVPSALLATVFEHVRKLFAISYAASRFDAKKDIILYNHRQTEKGIIVDWDMAHYRDPEDDPKAELMTMEQFDKSVWDELIDAGWLYWTTNETHIFARLCQSGPYADHVCGSGPNEDQVSVNTATALLVPSKPQHEANFKS